MNDENVSNITNCPNSNVKLISEQQKRPQLYKERENNLVWLCDFGRITVQEIVCRYQETLERLKRLPNLSYYKVNKENQHGYNKLIVDQLRMISLLFKRLRLIENRIKQTPILDNHDAKEQLPFNNSIVVQSEIIDETIYENYERLKEQVEEKNGLIKESIDIMREIVFSVNTWMEKK